MQAHSTLSKDAEDAENAEKQQMEYVRNLMQREMTNFKNKRKKDSALPLQNKKLKTILAKEKEPIVKMMKETDGDVWFKSEDAFDSNLLTIYNEGKTNAREKRFILQSAKIDDKITKQVIAFEGIFLKPGCLLYQNKNKQFFVGVKCVTCEKMHPRTTLFFNRNSEKLEDLESAQPAHEKLANKVSHPCRSCKRPQTEMQFLKAWKAKYIISIPQMIDKMFEQKGVGRISGLPIDFAIGKICICAYENFGGKNAFESHTDENTFYDIMPFNPAQGKHLGDLEEIYDEMSRLDIDLKRPNVEIFKTMHFTLQQSGVTANRTPEQKLYNEQREYCHLPYIIQLMVSNLIGHDLDAGRISTNNLAKTSAKTRKTIQKKVIDHIISINGKCELIGYDLTVINGPYRFSLDRIDNSKAHFLGEDCLDLSNIRVICRVLHTPVVQTVSQHQFCLNYRRGLPRDENGKAIYD
jgi:hypothetical protein